MKKKERPQTNRRKTKTAAHRFNACCREFVPAYRRRGKSDTNQSATPTINTPSQRKGIHIKISNNQKHSEEQRTKRVLKNAKEMAQRKANNSKEQGRENQDR